MPELHVRQVDVMTPRHSRRRQLLARSACKRAANAMSAMNLPPGVTAAGAGDIAGMSGFSADPNQQAQKQEQDAQKAQILKQILTPEALERLGRVKIVKTAKAEALEMKLIQMAMKGEIQKQVTEDVLINMLETAGAEDREKSKVKFDRRRVVCDSDDSDDNDDDLM